MLSNPQAERANCYSQERPINKLSPRAWSNIPGPVFPASQTVASYHGPSMNGLTTTKVSISGTWGLDEVLSTVRPSASSICYSVSLWYDKGHHPSSISGLASMVSREYHSCSVADPSCDGGKLAPSNRLWVSVSAVHLVLHPLLTN